MRSKSSLFLTEMILSILIFSIAAAVCVQIFVKAHLLSEQNENMNYAQNLAASMSELLSMTEVYPDDIFHVFPSSIIENDSIIVYFNESWEECSPKDASFTMEAKFHQNSMEFTGDSFFFSSGNRKGVLCITSKDGELYYDLPFFYHIPTKWQEEEPS